MVIIKKIEQDEYLIMDAVLIILGKGKLNTLELQYELLRCGIMVQQPLLEEVFKEMIKRKFIS